MIHGVLTEVFRTVAQLVYGYSDGNVNSLDLMKGARAPESSKIVLFKRDDPQSDRIELDSSTLSQRKSAQSNDRRAVKPHRTIRRAKPRHSPTRTRTSNPQMSENPQPQEAPVPGLLGGQARVPQPSGFVFGPPPLSCHEGAMPSLEYPVTRQYPWRWTTITVCFCAGFILVVLGLFNFAAVGYNVRSSYFDEFKDSKGVEWKNKLNIKYTGKCELESFDSSANPRYPPEDNSIHCDSSNIVLGGIYRTNVSRGHAQIECSQLIYFKNAIFALNVESLRDPVTTAPLGSANYSGDVLDSCRVNRIYMMAEYATHEVKYRVRSFDLIKDSQG
ncbi:Tetraspannin domain-containing protein [Rhizoctonia solani AG-1 IA]|uniref:Tetraspannin domain-containing protein n=1 Tax=Thanatephorus cucumeris (strain AG1-IA) TaxID=983506 RepID=L8WZG0_THACA|nr:Tetraspannin domain-containing protein [Rhizoctonia solani AG-1 IA]